MGMKISMKHHKSGKEYDRSSVNMWDDRLVLSKGHAAPILYSALYRAQIIKY